MNIIKKIGYIISAFVFLFLEVTVLDESLMTEVDASGKTLRQMKSELSRLEAKLAKNNADKQSAQSGINNSKATIAKISQEKVDIENNINDLSDEIVDMNSEIGDMNEEIKDILGYYQLSSTGDSNTVDYVFGAEDYSDLIYRVAVSEQLNEYYKEKITTYNKKIKENEDKKVRLADEKVALNKKEVQLEAYIEDQKEVLTKSMEGSVGLEEEIAALKKNIKLYEETYKCKLDETIDECLRGRLPEGSMFYRPLISGRVSSNYGSRTYKLNGRWVSDFHYALDMSSSHGSKVYSAADGKVAAIFRKNSCGGNMVYINHKVNGKKYTTGYYHLASINVSVGQTVSPETVIGYQGGNPGIEYWDRCSTGSHLHFTISTGNWGNEFSTYSGFIARNFNPRKVLNAPPLGGSFSNRYTKY